MSVYHVLVERDDGWYVGRVLERPGVTTQGRTLDELAFMLRDAISEMWNERDPGLELVLPQKLARPKRRSAGPARRAKRRAA